MANLILNKVYFKILNPIITVYLCKVDFLGAKKKDVKYFEGIAPINFLENSPLIYYSFTPEKGCTPFGANLLEHKYFLKPYVSFELRSYFQNLGMPLLDDFVSGLQIWYLSGEKSKCNEYEKINLRQVSTSNISKLELLVAFEGKSYVTQSTYNEGHLQGKFSKFIKDKALKKRNFDEELDLSTIYPVLGYELKKELNFPSDHNPTKNTYLEYYRKISSFYSKFLQGKAVGNNIQVFDGGFVQLTEKEIWRTKFVSNKLRFGNQGEDNSVYSGLKRYGPYAVPRTDDLRFIFVYKPEHSEAAKKLYATLSQGLKEGAFSPGLKDYLKVNFKMATQHRIVLDSNNPIAELEEKIKQYPFEEGLNYFVIYLTDHNRFESEGDNEEEYYKVKYLLLNRGILSQFIWHKNILGSSFRYHLPNIEVAILAKLGGIPWKLDTFSDDKLIIGFGVKKIGDNVFLGNSLFFKEDGTFHKFESFKNNTLTSIGDALKQNIQVVLQQGDLSVSKLVIHFYKTLNEEEGREIEKALKFFDLEIPFVVLTINDAKSRDFVFFDTLYENAMPVSGTIIELRWRSEYLLSNNMRHDETQSYNILQFPFPLKIKVNKSENVLYDVFDIKQLLDQVYSFSRIYWKSIGQASLPVTISYSKIVADLAAHFPDNQLPDNLVAHSNLWFL